MPKPFGRYAPKPAGDEPPADAPASPQDRRCAAFGCPELGTITHSTSGASGACTWLCRHHFAAESDEWAEITRRLRVADAETLGQPRAVPVNPYAGWSVVACQAEIKRIKGSAKPGPKAWAWRLREREIAGERLNHAQKDAWRSALRGEVTFADDEAQAERLAIMTEGV